MGDGVVVTKIYFFLVCYSPSTRTMSYNDASYKKPSLGSLSGAKQNGSHVRAHCHGCIEKQRPEGETIELDSNGTPVLSSQSWVIAGKQILTVHRVPNTDKPLTACKADVGGMLGVKEPMLAHILGKGGNSPCLNATSKARKMARAVKKGKGKRERENSGSESENDIDKKQPKRKQITNVETSLKQSQLKVFQGIQVPFTTEQEEIVHEQFLRATISANLPFQWVEDPEIITLFLLFQDTAGDVMPSRKQISGKLLDNADAKVSKQLKVAWHGKYAVLASDGWKDQSRNSINGVNLSVSGKVKHVFSLHIRHTYSLVKMYLIDLILATSHKKDGSSMCKAFEGMINKAEDLYEVIVMAFCCNNDGGSQRGRKDPVLNQPWLFDPPCCAHQVSLPCRHFHIALLRRISSSNSFLENTLL
jgi:hypothetical protein